jgi:hypothetical protein
MRSSSPLSTLKEMNTSSLMLFSGTSNIWLAHGTSTNATSSKVSRAPSYASLRPYTIMTKRRAWVSRAVHTGTSNGTSFYYPKHKLKMRSERACPTSTAFQSDCGNLWIVLDSGAYSFDGFRYCYIE